LAGGWIKWTTNLTFKTQNSKLNNSRVINVTRTQKLVKNLKWAAGKNNTKRVMLHSFAHLSHSKASPEFTAELFQKAIERMENADYETFTTPFGYFLDLDMQAPGYSLARIFKSF